MEYKNVRIPPLRSYLAAVWWSIHSSDVIHNATSCYLDNSGMWTRVRDQAHTYNDYHDDVIKWKNFPRYWPLVREIHRSPVNSLHKGQWSVALMFSLICAWINGWVINCEAGDLRHNPAHNDVPGMMMIGAATSDLREVTMIALLLHCVVNSTCSSWHGKMLMQRGLLVHVWAWFALTLLDHQWPWHNALFLWRIWIFLYLGVHLPYCCFQKLWVKFK